MKCGYYFSTEIQFLLSKELNFRFWVQDFFEAENTLNVVEEKQQQSLWLLGVVSPYFLK